ncbi:small-subunit processome [Exidia glandulosa HHB12029]|uniref:Small-subunit processome n=1 Tax=Exidia glandulosa HHB12029 TaxID=1314781 RepID=A0A165NBG9_EXIGL|nr:small-subunit processome [Exidia glandulosa HHB12029]
MPAQRKQTRKPQQSANARGFALRQQRRGKRSDASDAYEFSTDKVRREKVALDLDRDEERAGSGGDASDSDGDLRARIAKRVQEDEVRSEDDEDIDSDEAFEESDEERYASFKFSQKKPQSSKSNATAVTKSKQVNLDEDDDEGASVADDDETAYDPLAMLDGREPAAAVEGDDGDEDDEDDDEDSDSGAEEGEPMSDIDDAPDNDALESLGRYIAGLEPGKKRKAPDAADDVDAEAPQAKRRLLKEQTQAGVESEFNLSAGGGKLQLDDLLQSLSSTTADTLKASTKALKGSGLKSGALSAPLPGRTQDRLDREAAYEQTKTEVDKWKTTMKQIKEAEHLSFPLQPSEAVGVSTHELAAKFKPSTEMESAVDKLLRTAGLRDQDIEKTEALKMNHLSVEEVAARRAELLRTRDLMFRADAKAKRVARIKSKAFRRIRKKQREKLGEELGEDDDADEEEERLRLETARAKERATLRHKNTGKWARAMQTRGDLDEDQRRDINEMLAKGERLRRRIQGVGSGEESEGDDEDNDDDVDQIRANAFDELAQLDKQPDGEGKLKGVFEMKFMKDAMARRAREADVMADELRNELAKVDAEAENDSDEEATQETVPVVTDRVNGRMVFNPGNPVHTVSGVSAMSDASSVTLRSIEPPPTLTSSPGAGPSTLPRVPDSAASNPWLAGGVEATGKISRKKNEVVVGKDSRAVDKAQHVLSKQRKKATDEREREKDDAVVEISMTDVLKLSAVSDEEENNSEVDEQERLEKQKKGAKGKGKQKQTAFQQRDLVALAFAGDNVVEDFAELKRQEIEADAPKVEDTTLPGWGAWGGRGAKKQKPKPHLLKAIPGIDPTQRADHGKAHVIISEKKDKKAAKYTVKDLPFPYTSKAQFERTLEAPLGAEWNTRVGFQRGTLPRVVKKMGTVIAPVRKNL